MTVAERTSLTGVCALAFLFLGTVAPAADLRKIAVDRTDDRYSLRSEAYFAAAPEEMFRVLSNYDLYEQFSSAFVEARNMEPDEQGRPQFFTRTEGCILRFCMSFIRSGYLKLMPHSEIVATANPDASDFAYARERWRLRKEGDGTLLIYNFEMEPSFWVPPVLGPYLIKRKLRSSGGDAIDRIEALAQGRTPAP